MIPHCVIT